MLNHTYSPATAPIDFSFLQSLDGDSRSSMGAGTIQLTQMAECPTPVQRDVLQRPNRRLRVPAPRVGNRERLAVNRVCTAVFANLVFSAIIGLTTAIVAYLAGFMSQPSAAMFLLGSWSAHFVAGYTLLHQNAMFVPSQR